MSEQSPTRSAVVGMKDERRAMHEGYVFLDEKCLLLAGEMLRELHHHSRLQQQFQTLNSAAREALRAAVSQLGLHGLQTYPVEGPALMELRTRARSLMGVPLQDVQARLAQPASTPQPAPHSEPLWQPPEARACQQAHAALLACAAELAAVSGNLERLSAEYRRSVRRARALQDVMLPELDHLIHDFEGRLEELEQEDAIWMRRGGVAPHIKPKP